LFHILVSFLVVPSTTAWEKGLVKSHTSASQVFGSKWCFTRPATSASPESS